MLKKIGIALIIIALFLFGIIEWFIPTGMIVIGLVLIDLDNEFHIG